VAADSDVMAIDTHPQGSRAGGARDQKQRHPEDSEGIPASRSGHPKKGGVVNNFLMDGWQTRQTTNRTPSEQQEATPGQSTSGKYQPNSMPFEAFSGEPSPYANHIPVVMTADQTKRPSESQQRMRSYRVNSAIPVEDRGMTSEHKKNAMIGGLQMTSMADG